jgi:hypothetical protein
MAPFKSHSQSVLPNPRLLVLESMEQSEDRFLLSVRVEQVPSCFAARQKCTAFALQN